ncbi:hypothetical protein ACFYW6_13160 [Streptomyces sp. NPDC002659]|uniref:hypothetical protein n=1 Tax=Streptomyces sp. NPDC002659 TaxID=3364656 RepID=UPI0036AD4374
MPSSVRLQPHADGVGRDGGKKVAGRRGQVVDCLGLLPATAASVQDRDAAMPLLQRLRELHRRITLVWADGGYARSSTGARTRLRLALTIVKRTDDATGFVVLPRPLTGDTT